MDAPNYAGHGTLEEKFIDTASLTGEKVLADAKTVHNFICSNMSKDSDAYNWIKTHLNDRNCILYMVALR